MKKLLLSILAWVLFFVLLFLYIEFIEADHLYLGMSYMALSASISRLLYLKLSSKWDPDDVETYQLTAIFCLIIFVSILALLSLNISEPFMSILSIVIYGLAIAAIYKIAALRKSAKELNNLKDK